MDQDNDIHDIWTFLEFLKLWQVADLVDKLGRAVVQRDEHLREKSKAQAPMASGKTSPEFGKLPGRFAKGNPGI